MTTRIHSILRALILCAGVIVGAGAYAGVPNTFMAPGNFSNPTNWSAGTPIPGQDLIINFPCTYDVPTAFVYSSVTISPGVTFVMGNDATPRVLEVSGNFTVLGGPPATFTPNPAAPHILKIGGNLQIDGNFDCTAGGAQCFVEFKGGVQAISGTAFFSTFFDVLITAGATVTQNIPVSFNALTIQPTATFVGNQTISANAPVSVNGTYSVTSAFQQNFFQMVSVSPTGSFINSANADMKFNGGLDTAAGSTFVSGTGTTTFGTTQSLTGAAPIVFSGNVTVESGFTVNNFKNVSILGILDSQSGAFVEGPVFVPGDSWVNAPNSSLTLQGNPFPTMGTLNAAAIPNTVTYAGAGQPILNTPYNNLILVNSGMKSALNNLTVTGNFLIGTGATFNSGTGFLHTVGGAFSNMGTIVGSNVDFVFNGSGPQSISGTTTFGALTIANPSNVNLLSDQTVTGALTLSTGKLVTGANKLFLSPIATVTGASAARYIAGEVVRAYPIGAGQSFTYPIGDLTNFTPVAVSNFNVTTAGSLAANVIPTDSINIPTSTLNPLRSANRHWRMSASSIAGTFSAVFNFVAGDVDAGSDTSKFELQRFDGAAWAAVTVGTRTSTSISGTGINAAGTATFQAAELLPPKPPTITSVAVSADTAKTGVSLTFTAVAVAGGTGPLTFSWDFKDGSTPKTGNPVTHAFSIEGTFSVVLTVTEATLSTTATLPVITFKPASGGEGVTNVSVGKDPIVNPLNGLSVQVISSDGGVIELQIDISALFREAFSVSTDFDGINGRQGSAAGLRPVHKATEAGLIVATSTATEITTKVMRGRIRKQIVVSKKETGGRETGAPASREILLNSMKGKFLFNKGTPDIVTFSGAVELPSGLDLTQEQQFAIGMGNVIDQVNVDVRGRQKGEGALKRITRLRIKYPRTKGLTEPGQMAQISLALSTADMDVLGFDTEGITAALRRDEEGQKSVPRSIQVAMILGGIGYEGLAPVEYRLSTKKDAGQMATREGKRPSIQDPITGFK